MKRERESLSCVEISERKRAREREREKERKIELQSELLMNEE